MKTKNKRILRGRFCHKGPVIRVSRADCQNIPAHLREGNRSIYCLWGGSTLKKTFARRIYIFVGIVDEIFIQSS